jgi:hypothetical protein
MTILAVCMARDDIRTWGAPVYGAPTLASQYDSLFLMTLLPPLLLLLLSLPLQAADAAALFDRGVTWDAFLSGVEAQRNLWQTNARRATVAPELVDRLRKAGDGLRLLVIGEGSCSDSVSVVPAVAHLAKAAGVELRIVGRDEGRALLAQHKSPDGREATPTILLLRGSQVAGAFVERPAALQDWYLTVGAGLSQQERYARKMSWYDWDRGDSSVKEIVALAEKIAR